jgi:hypothetical protein
VTLRLVSDDERYVVPCQTTSCGQPAVILVIINETPPIACCDRCARRYYEMAAGRPIRLAPMSEYVDMYAAAREAALATPEQVMQVTASVDLDDKVLRFIWENQAIRCRMRWCEENGWYTPASQRLNIIGGFWYPACKDCIAKCDPSKVEVAPMSEEDTAWELRMVDEYARSKRWKRAGSTLPPAAGNQQTSSGPAWAMAGIGSLLCFIIGGVTCASGNAGGLAFIAIPFIIGFIAIIGLAVSGAVKETQQARTSIASAAQGYRQGIPVSQLAVPAALVGAEVLWHEQIKRHQRKLADSALGVAPLNQVHAGMKHAQRILQQQAAQRQAQWDARRQFQPDPIQAPFTGTPVSDIYGNVGYRKRPWP